ncbi:hypothetical protein E3E12_08130 [Formicincola oecophyllae]|uniref:Baseplate protein J-like barrel domain-containing protein n=1 Tax=Formicincola oecophyllae TaxID=2558361 RepID=A0A4Y6U9L2_9PROT|nr:baseplate J/gp47 family protein [Formicincola oecophyllae]QDH14163.1 hypothetical protein E3E12_08130 [Formicincola oecophyllae]
MALTNQNQASQTSQAELNQAMAVVQTAYPNLFTLTANSGVEPTAPTALRAQLVQAASQLSPGLTDLPATLIDDVASTATGALMQIDQAKVDLVNSVSPLNTTPLWLDQFGEIYGVARGSQTNPSALVSFTGPAGFFIGQGFEVTDGTYIFQTTQNMTIPASGVLDNVPVVATTPGSYSIEPYSITQIMSAMPATVTLSVTNNQAGTPGQDEESDASYRARILQAGMATCQGTPDFIRTCLLRVPNVVSRSISVRLLKDGYSVLVDGGDPEAIAGALFESCFDLPGLQGSTEDSGRNVSATLTSGPDHYTIQFVRPLQQHVSVTAHWQTLSTTPVADTTVQQAVAPPITSYINSLPTGAPISLLQLGLLFEEALSPLFSASLLSKLAFEVQVNGQAIQPQPDSSLLVGDVEGYFTIDPQDFHLVRD